MVSERLLRWRQYFAQVAHMCAEKVRPLPKGQRLAALRECMRENLKGKSATIV